jgi:hypothetical protein
MKKFIIPLLTGLIITTGAMAETPPNTCTEGLNQAIIDDIKYKCSANSNVTIVDCESNYVPACPGCINLTIPANYSCN